MDKASISFNNKTYEFPVVSGTEDEYGIDISSLRKDSGGLITFDRGFKIPDLVKVPLLFWTAKTVFYVTGVTQLKI